MSDVLGEEQGAIADTIEDAQASMPSAAEQAEALASEYDFEDETPVSDDTSADESTEPEESSADSTEDSDGDEESQESLEEVDEEPQEEDAPYEWDEDLLAKATKLGFTDEEAMAGGTNQSLEALLSVVEARLQSQAPEEKQEEVGPEKDATTEEVESVDLGIDPELLDDEAVKAFGEVGKYVQKLQSDNKELLGQLSELRSTVDALLEADVERGIDSAITNMVSENEALKDILGEGSLRKLGNAEHKANRAKLVDAANTIAAGLHARGKTAPDDVTLMKRAMRLEFGEKMDSLVKSELRAENKARIKGSGSRPTKKRATPSSGDERAANALREYMQQNGITPDPSMGYMDDDPNSIY